MYATRISDRIYLIDTMALGQPGLVGAYVVKGPKVAVIDCGHASSCESVLAGLSEIGVSPSDIRYLIPTHVHLDHAGAAGHLIERMPNAEIVAQERGVPHLVDPSRLIESATEVFGKQIMELYGLPLPVRRERITAVGEEAHLDLGGGMTADLIHTPGHAPHQMSVVIEGAGALITADAVGIIYPGLNTLIPTTPPPSFDPSTLVSTASRLEQTDPDVLLVPHFGARGDVDRVFEDTRMKVQHWVKSVGELRNKKMDLEGISQVMIERVKRESGAAEVPIYAQVSVRTSVMGILHYLDKNP